MTETGKGDSGAGAPESPCIGVCTIDAQDYCIGCARSLNEIAAWSQMTAVEQQAVVDALPERLARLEQRRSAHRG